jgi:hypothetical protein
VASLKELDVVAVLRDRPDLGVSRGWVGTLLLELSGGIWEVEFADTRGTTIKTAPVEAGDLLLLQMDPVATA